MTATLTDRYVLAATRTVPESQRAELAAELRERIADQLDARREAGDEAADAERRVLIDLGDPEKLAAAYVDRPLWLIGPRYYLDWWRLVKLLLWIVLPLAAFGVALGQTLAGTPFGGIVGSTIGVTISVGVHLVFWTTVVFVAIERSAPGATVPGGRAWTPDDLPEGAEPGTRFSDLIATVVFLVLAAAALIWDQTVGTVYLDGAWMSFLGGGLWPWWIGGLLLLMSVEVMFQIVVFLHRRWTLALATVNTVLNLLFVVPALWLLSQGQLLNDGFWYAVIPTEDAGTVFGVVSIVTGFLIVGIAAWDAVEGFLKARRAR